VGSETPDRDNDARPLRSTLVRAGLISLAMIGLALGAVAVVGWLSADKAHLPLEYDGFDEGPQATR
jgi:hypothetical protein